MSDALQADYLVVGAGAMGMAFTDAIVTETDKSVILIDRHHRPGGHWNDAYPFVRLHQPSAFYGVNSKALGNDMIDAQGWNEGLYELASSSEVCTYFDQVMQQQFLPSGRVQFLPMSEYAGDGKVTSRVSGATRTISAGKIVDATYMNVTVPSIRTPPFAVDDEAQCVPVNGLATVSDGHARYAIIGGGKTSMDACLFLLGSGVAPEAITWIRPRDSWILDRAFIQPGKLAAGSARAAMDQSAAVMQANNADEVLLAAEAAGSIMRIDATVTPTMYRCATCTVKELNALRTITDVVRMGHVTRITCDTVELEQGSIETGPDVLHVDCSADGLARRPVQPVFDGNRITLQSVRTCQQVFSAAFIGHVEAAYESVGEKNDLCQVVPHPDTSVDFLRTMRDSNRNAARWAQDAGLQTWLQHARLDGFSRPPEAGSTPPEAAAIAKLVEGAAALQAKLETLIDAAGN